MNCDEFNECVNKYFGIQQEKNEQLNKLFKDMDANGDQLISYDEVMKVIQEQRKDIPEKVIKTIISLADSNKDGQISRREFARFFRLLSAVESNNIGGVLFSIADKDKDGVVRLDELQILSRDAGWTLPADVKEMTHEKFIDFANEFLGIANDKHYY